jgi:uncharacterized protein
MWCVGMIKNITSGNVLVKNKVFCRSVFQKAKGLMFSNLIYDVGYIFVFDAARRIDLHMFFVFFIIDVIFLDDNKKVIELKENFLPFTFYYSKNKAKYFIELPKGTIVNKKIKINDVIEF